MSRKIQLYAFIAIIALGILTTPLFIPSRGYQLEATTKIQATQSQLQVAKKPTDMTLMAFVIGTMLVASVILVVSDKYAKRD